MLVHLRYIVIFPYWLSFHLWGNYQLFSVQAPYSREFPCMDGNLQLSASVHEMNWRVSYGFCYMDIWKRFHRWQISKIPGQEKSPLIQENLSSRQAQNPCAFVTVYLDHWRVTWNVPGYNSDSWQNAKVTWEILTSCQDCNRNSWHVNCGWMIPQTLEEF